VQLKILTRSFLIDITLVAIASFTLACVLWEARSASSQSMPSSTKFIVEHRQADGTRSTYLITESTPDVDQVREELVQRLIGRPDSQVALVQWYRETAEFYVAATQLRIAAETLKPEGEASVFKSVSARQNLQSPPDEQGARNSQWLDFWMQRQVKADSWLATYTQSRLTRAEALRGSLSISRSRQWIPSTEACQVALVLSLCVAMLGSLWRVVCPARSLKSQNLAWSNSRSVAVSESPAAMRFRESWVRVKQPFNVKLRHATGWSLVLSGVAACLVAVWCG
jgi:hypothetical protein